VRARKCFVLCHSCVVVWCTVHLLHSHSCYLPVSVHLADVAAYDAVARGVAVGVAVGVAAGVAVGFGCSLVFSSGHYCTRSGL